MIGKVVSQCLSKNGFIINGIVFKSDNGTSVATSIQNQDEFYGLFGDTDLTGRTVSGPMYYNNGRAMMAIVSLVKAEKE